jgi:thioredoxin reductase (NADPH)
MFPERSDLADILVYGAPWCPDCRRSKKFLTEHRIPFDWYDIDQDQKGLELVEKMQDGGRSIPTIVFKDGSFLVEPSDAELARKLDLKVAADHSFYDLAIVGGGPAGLTAALYAAREGITSIVIEKSALGGQAGVTEWIDNYPGFPDGINGAELAGRFVQQARRYSVELLGAASATRLATEREDVLVSLSTGQTVVAHAALIATGSSYRKLGVPGENRLIGAGVHFCATCDGPFYKGSKELLVIGGGNSGLEEGLFLSQFADRIRIVEYGSEMKASKLLQDKVRNHPQFSVHTNTEILELQGKNKLTGVTARDRATGETYSWQPAAAFVFIGLDPNTAFLKDAVELDQWGLVVTDEHFMTSMPGVFAAGDVRRGSTKQLASAVGEGVTALLMVREYLKEHHHVSAVTVND